MRAGDFEAAWTLSDAVMAQRDRATRDDPAQPYHRRWVWDGRSFEGRHVLVRCYHGLGDTLQFARYLPALSRYTASTTLEVQPELVPLLSTLSGVDRLIPFRTDAPHPPSECDLEIMELAHALRLQPYRLPPPYLRTVARPVRADTIGLCWRSGGWDRERGIPDPILTPIFRLGLPFVSLCPNPSGPNFINPRGCPKAIEATADLMAELRLIITVDTMVAHLAGALGLPTWLLLKHNPDWRWGDGAWSSWYPRTRLFRQPLAGDWQAVIATVTRDLESGVHNVPAA